MKIYITKKDPYEFSRSGMDMLSVWSCRPEFIWGCHTCPVFGIHDIVYPKWQGDFLFSGRYLRKMASEEIRLDIWKALKYSYVYDEGQHPYNIDMYEPNREYYQAAETYWKYGRIGSPKYSYVRGETELNEKLKWYRETTAIKYASKIVEKEGQRWWQWCLEYDISLNLKVCD